MRAIVPTLAAAFALGATALGQSARLEFAHPIAGSEMVLTVDRAPPGRPVVLALMTGAAQTEVDRSIADGSGCARFRIPVAAAVAGEEFVFVAQVDGAATEPVAVRIQAPTLLVTGIAGDVAVLERVPVLDREGRAFPRALRSRIELGPGLSPGGAVLDARAERIFAIADAPSGLLRTVGPDGSNLGDVRLRPGLRGIAISGDRLLVASGGAGGELGTVTLLDARGRGAPVILAEVDVGPLGTDGGRIVVAADRLRAFIAIGGLYLREVNLLRSTAGALVKVGGPGQDRLRDLRLVDGNLFALTSRGVGGGALTGLEVRDLASAAWQNLPRGGAKGGVGFAIGARSLVVLDGEGAAVTVVNARTMRATGVFAVPPGADALVLTPNPDQDDCLLLYGEGEARPVALPLSLADFRTGTARALDFSARALPVQGFSTLIDWLFLGNGADEVFALDPERGADAPIALGLNLRDPVLSVSE